MVEYYALSTAMQEVVPLRDTIQKVANGLGLGPACETTFRTTVWEDNNGCLHLANMDPGQHTALEVLRLQGPLVQIVSERSRQQDYC